MVEDTLNYEEAARELNIATATLQRWVQQRKIRFLKIGKFVRFRRSDLEEFIQRNTVEPRGRL